MSDSPLLLVYGATGYTGKLIIERCVEAGLRPIVSGRNPEKVAKLAAQHGLEGKAFSLDDPAAVKEALKPVHTVLHCAGPFVHTYKTMVKACLETGTHYLDITGEFQVFEGLAARSDAAKKANITLLPGVGFDVVPTDCVAGTLKAALPDAHDLQMAFLGLGGGMSHGTAKTAVENLHSGSLIRRNGKLKPIPHGSLTRKIDFGRGEAVMSAIPWGDISTAWHQTHIPNITVYTYIPGGARFFLGLMRPFMGLFKQDWMINFMKKRIENKPAGPSENDLENGKTLIWGRVENKKGESREILIKTAQGYKLTAHAAVEIAKRTLSGNWKPGFMTPALSFGPELIFEFEGTEIIRKDWE